MKSAQVVVVPWSEFLPIVGGWYVGRNGLQRFRNGETCRAIPGAELRVRGRCPAHRLGPITLPWRSIWNWAGSSTEVQSPGVPSGQGLSVCGSRESVLPSRSDIHFKDVGLLVDKRAMEWNSFANAFQRSCG